ncbi:MAG TPA: SDR family NAD(P)-dependent oxidoreductase [Pirellulaceae bacterium]|nr:SDR family NAD(P)-dependent oxidoreductase [Pirellulaceae bacterium]
MDLQGKAALVTGGTMGIGAAIAIELACRGADVAIAARNLGEPAHQVRAATLKLGRRCLLLAADFTSPEDCTMAVEKAVQQFGRLDVLVHNAGGPSPGRIEEITPEQWRQTMDLHVNANFYLVRAALPHLKKHKEGAIVTISSTAGIRGVPGALAYATAKGAIPQFTRSLARDLADDNIRVNCVAPGVIRTRFHADMTAERKELNLKHRIPLHREGTSEQVAEVVALLVTNDYITGETIVIDGGLTSRIA